MSVSQSVCKKYQFQMSNKGSHSKQFLSLPCIFNVYFSVFFPHFQQKHCVLDVTPYHVDRLNYAQYYPIVVFLRGENKQAIKEVRSRWRAVGNSNKNPKKLHEHNERMDNLYSHLFTGELDDENDDDCVDDDGEDEELPRNFLHSMRQ